MSDERFELAYEQGNWWAVRDGDITLWKEEVVDLLNTLHQENQQLKHYKLYEDNKRLQTIIADLKEENEQLKQELQGMEELFWVLRDRSCQDFER